jgi:hypothetical protein
MVELWHNGPVDPRHRMGWWRRLRVRARVVRWVVGVLVCGWPTAGWTQVQTQTVPNQAAAHPSPLVTGAELFADYTVLSEPKALDAAGQPVAFNAFSIGRAAFSVGGRLTRLLSFQITPDVVHDTDTASSLDGSYVLRLRHAYLDLGLDGKFGHGTTSWVRLGVQPTPLVEYEEQIYRYRFQGTVFVERVGALVSADAGASFYTTLPHGYGDVHVGVFNGEGYATSEVNNQKALQVRGTVRPFPGRMVLRGLRATGFYDTDHYVADAPRTRAVVSATFEHRRFNAGVDYLRQSDQPLPDDPLASRRGWSAWVTPFFMKKGHGLEGLLRYDAYRRDVTVDQTRRRVIAGVAYWFSRDADTGAAALLFDLEQLTFEGSPSTPATARQRRLAVHALITF